MAARPAERKPLHIPTIIDLTYSDEEDNLARRPRAVQPSRAFTAQVPQDFPVSNHELIPAGTFDFSARPQSAGNTCNGNSDTAFPVFVQSLGIGNPTARPQTSIRPQTNTNGITINRRSTDHSFPRTVITAVDRRISVEENGAKRRKTYGRIASQESHIAVPSRVVSVQTRRGDAPAAESQRIYPSTSGVILPPASHGVRGLGKTLVNRLRNVAEGRMPIAAQSSALSTQDRNGVLAPASKTRRISPNTRSRIAPVARHRVSVAARLQAGKSRISLNGRIQKPQYSSHRAASVVPKDQDERMIHVICSQVFKHIKPAVEKYRSSLNSDDRQIIGAKTAAKLVEDSSFIENFTANESKLSAEYERNLSIRAQSYVGKFALEILNRKGLDSRGSGKKEESFNASTDVEVLSTVDRGSNGNEKPMTPSSCSENEEEVFELPSEAPVNTLASNNRISRHYSSSPTTSFSNDAYDGASAMDLDSHDETNPPNKATKRRSPRQLRSSRPSKLETMQSMNTDHPGLAQELKQKSILQEQKSSISSLCQIQTLRLAGGDKKARRPYLSFRDRENIRLGCEISDKYPGRFLSRAEQDLLQQSVFHVDLCLEELEFLCKLIQAVKKDTFPLSSDPRSQIIALMSGQESVISAVISIFQKVVNWSGKELGRVLLQKRETTAIEAFLRDAVEGEIASVPSVARIESTPSRRKTQAKPPISSLLRQREVYGLVPVRVRRGQQCFKVEMSSHLEDTLVRKSEWTDCCGDISTVSWTGEGTFICGATAHSDFHNMQYNKPGNLVVGSSSLDTLRAVANHRIIRPVIGKAENAENALESMRRTQDPWLYTSVVSTSHSEISGFTFTASFDDTVKVWKVSEDGSSMDLFGTWNHYGKVNFVVTSNHHERVATASDVYSDAIRVYNFNEEDITDPPYDTYCGERALEQAQEVRRRDTWAYFPATIQWGKAPDVSKFLLVGYSPRSVTAHEIDIPDEKKNSGELCLWNVETGDRVPISSARTQNVFEVMWHPTQPCFLAATSPCGVFEPEIRTQIRLFAQNEFGSFLQIKALDCPAFDINELTIMPNSSIQCYVTASCTDGNTYVWDTAQGDRPIHTLGHGESLDNPIHDLPRQIADTGVKFASWGKTADRFYTGSSDGKVKAWDIRKPKGHAFVRTVLSVSGSISAGAFSKNFSKLLIGDGTGKVHLLELNNNSDDDSGPATTHWGSGIPAKMPKVIPPQSARGASESGPANIPRGSGIRARKPKVIIPHPEPPPPAGFGLETDEEEPTAQDMAQIYLDEGQLKVHPDRGIGAVQGPNYAETLLFRYEAHEDNDGTSPLLPEWQAKQRYEVQSQEESLNLPYLPVVKNSDPELHAKNMSLDLDFSRLSLSTQNELRRDGVDLGFEPERNFDYELLPRFEMFKKQNRLQKRTHNM